MRNASPAFLAALANAGEDGLDVRRFIYIKAQSRAETPVPFPVGIWSGDDDISIALVDGETGLTVTRTYYGQGASLKIPSIPRTSDFSIQNIEVKISQLNPINQLLVRENTVRLAKVDIHEGIIDAATGLMLTPEIVFLGEVDGDPIDTPAAGGEGSISIEIVSDAIRALTRTNPAKRSDETQQRRSGDRFSRYSNLVANMTPTWGE